MAKDTKKKAGAGKKDRSAKNAQAPAARKKAKVSKAVKAARTKAAELASNPLVVEVVAATLVAAAAALRSPDKARAMAAAAAEELESLAADAKGQGGAFWQLALDVARKSLESAGAADAAGAVRQDSGRAPKTGKKKKKKAKT